jgi:hypothetical protein
MGTKTFCDYCGKEVGFSANKGYAILNHIKTTTRKNVQVTVTAFSIETADKDFCKDCLGELARQFG